jgi:hypothetical protein
MSVAAGVISEVKKTAAARILLDQITEEALLIADCASEHEPESWRNCAAQLEGLVKQLVSIRRVIGCEEEGE